MFKVIDIVVGLRSKPEDEIAGLDIPEMGVLAYPDDAQAHGAAADEPARAASPATASAALQAGAE